MWHLYDKLIRGLRWKKVLKVRGGDANMLGKMSHCHPLWHCRDIFLTFNIITNIKISFPLGLTSSHSTSTSISTSTSRCPQPCPWPWCEVFNTPPTCFWNTSSFCYSTDLSSRPTKKHPHTNTHWCTHHKLSLNGEISHKINLLEFSHRLPLVHLRRDLHLWPPHRAPSCAAAKGVKGK